MNDLPFTDKGLTDYVYWQMQDRKTLKRINSIITEIQQGIARDQETRSFKT